MRRVFSSVVRGVVAVSVIAALAMPAEARPVNKDRSIRDYFTTKIVKVVRILGDLLTDPRP